MTDDRGVKPACSLLPPLPPSLSLAWEALIPSACNRHPSPFSRGSGAYGREREGRIGSHGEGEGSLNLKDTHARWIIRIATKITRTILDDVKIDLLLLSNSIWLIRWQSFENPAKCYKCFKRQKIGPCHLNLLYHILYFWLKLSHNLVTLGLKDIPTWKLNKNYPNWRPLTLQGYIWHFDFGTKWYAGKFCYRIDCFFLNFIMHAKSKNCFFCHR